MQKSYFLVICYLSIAFASSCSLPNVPKHELAVMRISADHEDLFSDSVGIYVKGVGTHSNWQGERANYFSGRKINAFLSYDDGSCILESELIRIKVSGGGSRKQAQKSFNISMPKSEARAYLDCKFFENLEIDQFQNLRLRVSGQDWRKTHLRDALMHSLVSDLNIDVQAYKPVVLYLNDEYWGIYNLREKFNPTYIRSHHEIEDSIPINILEQNMNVRNGKKEDYQKLMEFIKANNLAISENYRFVESQIDIDNLLDYYCSQIYFANTDWPGNNIKFWRSQKEGSQWRWFLHDTDLGFGRAPLYGHPGGAEHNTLLFNLNNQETILHNQPWATFLLRNLLENGEFKAIFESHFRQLLDSHFNTTRVNHFIDSLSNGIRLEMANHIARWSAEDPGFIQSLDMWEENLTELYEFSARRPEIVASHLDSLQFYLKQIH